MSRAAVTLIFYNILTINRYTYGQPVKGKAKIELSITQRWGNYFYYTVNGDSRQCGSGERCRWDSGIRESVCQPRQRCPSISHDLEVPSLLGGALRYLALFSTTTVTSVNAVFPLMHVQAPNTPNS